MRKAIITVVGKDATGIIARVCMALAGKKVNILEISQTIIDGFFNMIMVVDYAAMEDDFSDMVSLLDSLGEEIGVSIRCQREEIFTSMHRI